MLCIVKDVLFYLIQFVNSPTFQESYFKEPGKLIILIDSEDYLWGACYTLPKFWL